MYVKHEYYSDNYKFLGSNFGKRISVDVDEVRIDILCLSQQFFSHERTLSSVESDSTAWIKYFAQ